MLESDRTIKRLSNFGFTTVELLIASLLIGVVMIAVTRLAVDVLNGSQQSNAAIIRDRYVGVIRESAGNLKALRQSMGKPENSAFHDCVCGGGNGCTSMQSNSFTLYDNLGNVQSPIYLDTSGSPCSQTTTNCVIRVQTNFMAECLPNIPNDPTPPLNCTTPAEFVVITYTVDQNPGSLSGTAVLKPVKGGVFTQIVDLAPAGSGVCP